MNARWHILIALSLVVSLWQLGCDSNDEDVTSKRSSVKVQLPAKPDLKKPAYKRVHGDGVLTVEGLLRERDAHLNRQVTVRGKVEALKLCEAVAEEPATDRPDDASKSKKGKRRKAGSTEPLVAEKTLTWKCKQQPYAMLVDAAGSKRHRLRVGGTMGSRLASLKVGEMVDLHGIYDVVSPNRKYMDQNGVLFLKELAPSSETASPSPPGEK